MSDQNVNPSDEEPIAISPSDDEPPISLAADEDEPISLVDDGPSQGLGKLKAFGAGTGSLHKEEFRRALNLTQTGATRCRLFRSKLSVASLEAMEKTINDWLDGDEIEVKQVAQVIGTIQGKTPEANLIVTVWY